MSVAFTWAQAVDLGFVVMVTAACLRSLMTDTESGERTAKKWREELLALEQMLRALIEEAGVASSALDRRLVQRKQELEGILKKVDSQTAEIEQLANSQRQAAVNNAQRAAAAQASGPIAEDEPYRLSDETGFFPALGAKPAAQAPAARPKASAAAPLTKATAKKTLAQQIELVNAKDEEPGPDTDPIFRQLSITDFTAYKVARRLLNAGQEIHVVARKLDIPVSEIRELDRLVRQAAEQARGTVIMEVPDLSLPQAPAAGISKSDFSRSEFAPQAVARVTARSVAAKSDTLDLEIERELALL